MHMVDHHTTFMYRLSKNYGSLNLLDLVQACKWISFYKSDLSA